VFRNHIKFNNLEGFVDRKLGEVNYEQKTTFKEGKWAFRLYSNYNLTQNSLELSKYFLSWQDETYGGAVNLTKEADKHTSDLYLNYKYDSTLSLGSKYTYHHSKDLPNKFTTGLKWSPDKVTTFKANMDCSLLNQFIFSHTLDNGTK